MIGQHLPVFVASERDRYLRQLQGAARAVSIELPVSGALQGIACVGAQAVAVADRLVQGIAHDPAARPFRARVIQQGGAARDCGPDIEVAGGNQRMAGIMVAPDKVRQYPNLPTICEDRARILDARGAAAE